MLYNFFLNFEFNFENLNIINESYILKYTIILCVYILFLINIKNIDISKVYEIYNKFINEYNDINIIVLSEEHLMILINNFKNLNYEKENMDDKTLIEYIIEFYKEIKKLKKFVKIFKNYTINFTSIKNIIEHINLNKNYETIIGLFTGIGELYLPISLKKINFNNIYFYDKNTLYNKLLYLNCLISFNIDLKKFIINSDILYDNLFNKQADLVICNIPYNFKNIIYSKCSKIIKKLKIRGTKIEPLILQLILQIINKNGDILLITHNSLLFSNSNQHIETRKYLINNFNIKKIIELPNRKSLLVIKNNKLFDYIEIVKNKNTFKINKNDINKENYNLFFNEINNIIIPSYFKSKLSDIILIKFKEEYICNKILTINKKILYNYKFNNLKIDFINENTDFNFVFLSKDENIINQDFLNIYLLKILNKHIDNFTEGKMKKLLPNLIYNFNISLIPLVIQQNILSQINLNNLIIINLREQINNYLNIINNSISSLIIDSTLIKISDVIVINNQIDENTKIVIKKNSLTSGNVELINNKNTFIDNQNYYYLNINDNELYYYYLLKFYENKFINNSLKNKSNGLSKSFLENFTIPILIDEKKNHLILICNYFYEQINLMHEYIDKINKNNLLQLDIF